MQSKRPSPNDDTEALKRKRDRRKARYRYARLVLAASNADARTASQSPAALMRMFPDHTFPPELVVKHRPWQQTTR